jgi:hypothetical protein
MKRLGFVSNSSSCSFYLYGTWVDADEISAFTKIDDTYDAIEELEKQLGPEFSVYDRDGSIAIGVNPSEASDDETFGSFKKRVADKLSAVFPSRTLSWIEDSWYNG